MVSSPDPRLQVSFHPSPDPLASTNIDKDVDPHREINDEHWDLVVIEEEHARNSPENLEVAPDIQPLSEAPPSSGLLADQLQLVFGLRRDVAELLFGFEFLNRLDIFMDSISRSSNSRRCPTCRQPYLYTAPWHTPPRNDGASCAPGM
jgi:hypothetical protein